VPLRIVITAGPSYAPLDGVRRLTNLSTGELGTLLAEKFAANGHRVLCLRGEGATFSTPLWGVEVVPFSTNESLQSHLTRIVAREDVNFVFHAAALCDFTVRSVTNEQGEPIVRDKASSREGPLRVTLDPAPKLLAGLRKLFPASILVGWKYEIDGTLLGIMEKGRAQMDECLTDACVVNGRAYGAGYGVISRAGEKAHLPDKPALSRFLVEWAEHMPVSGATPRQESFHALASFMPMAPFI
jgi:phosphopantothenoylcysteine decarboxylase/phosphopantothenate--cysteine ligase